MLIYSSIAHMASYLDEYDYFLNIEDDIYIPPQTVRNVFAFDETSGVSEVLHPNRIEFEDGAPFCVDLRAMPGWTTSRRTFARHALAVALNPHSGLMLLSRAKFAYAQQHVDFRRRERIIGDLMASAYCNVHAPFALWRSFDDIGYHTVEHLDRWMGP